MRHRHDTVTYDIFDPHFLARSDDPETSHEAAARVAEFAARHHQIILDVLLKNPQGLTAHEIAEQCNLQAHAIGKRLNEMHLAGMILVLMEPGGTGILKRKTPTGRHARVWIPKQRPRR